SGQQARTNFRASRISPGHHVLEIRGDRFKPWQQEVEIEPGAIRKVQATLIPAVGGPAGGGSGKPAPIANAPSTPARHDLAMASAANTGVSPSAAVVPPAPAAHKPSGGGSGAGTGAGSGPLAAGGGGAVASPSAAGPGTGKRRRARETPAGDDTNGD